MWLYSELPEDHIMVSIVATEIPNASSAGEAPTACLSSKPPTVGSRYNKLSLTV